MRRADLLDNLRQDVGHGFRMIRRNPGFATVVIASLALGIGANASIFSLVDAVLLRPLPVTRPRELVIVGSPARVNSLSMGNGLRGDIFSTPMYVDIRDQSHAFTGLAASGRAGQVNVLAGGDSVPSHPRARLVSANYFSVLGVRAAAGQLFDGTEDRAEGAAPVAVITDGYWERRFARDRSVIGRAIKVNGASVTVIGVSQAGFDGEIVGATLDIFFPISLQSVLSPHQQFNRNRMASWLVLIGRLKSGATIAGARAEATQLVRESYGTHPLGGSVPTQSDVSGVTAVVESGARGLSSVRNLYEGPLWALTVGVGILLLIICANVANLLLARTAARSREIGVRLAIGAGRGRLVRQLLTESAVLAGISATAALALAWWGSRLLLALEADGRATTIPLDVGLNLPVVGYTLAIAAGTVLLFGVTPALRAAGYDLATAMRSGARSIGAGGRGRRPSVGMMLVGAQMALSVVLLVASALLVRNLGEVENSDPGLDRDHLLVADVGASRIGYADDRFRALATELRTKLAALPGVAAVSYSDNGLFSGSESANTLQVPGFTPHQAGDSVSRSDDVGPGYVAALGGRIVDGRDISDDDVKGAAPVILVNEAFVKFFLNGKRAVGTTVRFSPTTTPTIVGVVADTKDHTLTEPPQRRFYGPWQQALNGPASQLRFVIRATGNPSALSKSVRDAILAVDPQLPVDGLTPLSFTMRASVREQRLLVRLASGFGVLALVLCAVGLYGVMSYSVARRTGEIGLRTALGATQPDVMWMVLRDASRVVAVGAAVGLPLAYWGATLMKKQIDRVSPADPASLAVALITLAVAALLAAFVPALRASRVAPVEALRAE